MLPSGWVTFAFTDIEGSTRLAQTLGERYRPVLHQYRRLLVEAVRGHGGAEVFTEYDSCFAAFPDAGAALRAGRSAQAALDVAWWPDPAARPRVRMGLHSGHARPRAGEYASLEVHRAARVAHAAHGGQVLCSAATARSAAPLPAPLSLRDLGLHRLRGFDGRERLFQLVAPGWDHRFPPPRTEEAPPHNLPAALTSFVGRSAERASLSSLLRDHRLVTVTGAAGLGKSRLAVRVAGDQVGAYLDGVWYLDLSTVADPHGVVLTIAAALGLPPRASQRGWHSLVEFLADRRLLLVLDGCDAQPGAVAPVVARLLAGTAWVRVLATARQPVGVPGEAVWRLRPLSHESAVGSLGCDAVQLLVDRAAAARGGVVPQLSELADLVRIAERLGGVPLAIERAAARLRVLTAGQLAARLDTAARLDAAVSLDATARLDAGARLGAAATLEAAARRDPVSREVAPRLEATLRLRRQRSGRPGAIRSESSLAVAE